HFCRAILALGGDVASGSPGRSARSPWKEFHATAGDWKPPADLPNGADWVFVSTLTDVKPDPKLKTLAAKLGPALAELEESCKHSPALIPNDFETDKPFAILLPHVQDARNLARGCRAVAFQALVDGDPRKAFRTVLLCLKLADRLDQESFLISKLVQMAIFKEGCETLAIVMGHAAPTPAEFAALDAQLRAPERFSFRECMFAEQAAAVESLEHLDPDELFAAIGVGLSSLEGLRLRLLARYQSSWLGEPDRIEEQIWLLKNVDRRIVAFDDLGPIGAAAMAEFEAECAARRYASVLGVFMPAMKPAKSAKTRHLALGSLARGCLRGQRYAATHGRLPDKIADFADADWSVAGAAPGLFAPEYLKTKDGFTLRTDDPTRPGAAAPAFLQLDVAWPAKPVKPADQKAPVRGPTP
ncbi:MAG TPA: hypothetical protein VNC50_21535, partial [Planctomycetia bacterium]|nr:hypothetical protein [Planctomycetia bacterium]